MKISKIRKAGFIFAALFVFILQATAYAANTEIIKGGYTVNGQAYDLIKGVFKFPAISSIKINSDDVLIDLPARFFYSDGFFAEDPYRYNSHLATASLCMAMSGFYSNEGATGKNEDYSNKWKNIRQYMLDIGVASKDIYRNDYNMIRPQTDSIGVTIGSKNLSTGRKLIIISIRGANYEKEWASNVTLGTSGEAQGFSRAAGLVFSSLENYIAAKNLENEISDGKVDFWISGYSRAGATTNLTAKRLIDKYISGSKGNHVFAYCIEAPQGGLKNEEKSGSDYTCIHSVINKNDVVPYVAPKDMSFKRYGVDHYLPGTEAGYVSGNSDNMFYDYSSSEYLYLREKMLIHLHAVSPHINFADNFSSYGLDLGIFGYFNENSFIKKGDPLLMNNFLDTFFSRLFGWTNINREKYVSRLQTALRNYTSIVFDAHPAQLELFNERLLKLWDKDVGKIDILGAIWYALGEWGKPNFKHKAFYINKVINLLEKNKCYDALMLPYAEKQKLMRIDLPLLLDFIMTFASEDYRNNLYNTRGLTQILTFAFNSKNIMMNHYPEVTLAWLRTQDSLYDNELDGVNSAHVMNDEINTAVNIYTAESEGIITNITEVPEIFAERGTEPKSVLPSTVTAEYNNGETSELSITWNDANTKWYSPTYNLSGDMWSEIDDIENALTEPDPIMGVFSGRVNIPDGAKLSGDVSADITASVYIAGTERLDPPEASLPDGEYNGPQEVIFNCLDGNSRDIVYLVSNVVEYDDGGRGGGGDFPTNYTGPITIGKDVQSEDEQYMLVASVESNESDKAKSETLIWSYKIMPLNSEDVNSEYVSNTTSKIFTLSKDTEVLWRTVENPESSIFVYVTPSNSEEVSTKTVNVTVITIEGTTKRGVYKIPVQISTDGGITWTDETEITFETVRADDKKGVGTSGSGCNSGLTAIGLCCALSAIIVKNSRHH